MNCPSIPSKGSYEDFKILAETYQTDVKALIDLHRYMFKTMGCKGALI